MALVRALVVLAVIARVAAAQAPPDAGVDAPPPADAAPPPPGDAAAPPPGDAAPAQPQFEPPQPLGSTDVAAPPGAPAITQPVVVTVKLRIDKTGAVDNVTLVTPPEPPPANVFDDAVIAAAKSFLFKPATFGGKPVKVDIDFTHTFEPPPPPPPPPP
ncbi:MAG: energy transducer TonB, partial [Acidobacteriota bacterium]